MFKECYNLQTIYVGPNWTTAKAEPVKDMFQSCGTNKVTLKEE